MASASYYDDLRGRVRAVLFIVAEQLPRMTVELVTELIDANESGVALETISEVLVERESRITADTLDMVRALVTTMGLDAVTVERLEPLLAAGDDGLHA